MQHALSHSTVPLGDDWHDIADVRPRLGRYQVRGLLGAGGMGVVFEAFDPVLDRAVAIKVLRSTARERDAAGLLREGMTMGRVTHPNVIRVYDIGIDGGNVFVAMELVHGCTLAEWMTRAPRSTCDVIGAYVQAGRGLAAAHEVGVVHRDFKPANVLVGDDGRVLVADFGLARSVGDIGSAGGFVTEVGPIVGTPAFMAPEQRTGGPVDARADQYSFCLALWSDLTTSPRRVPARIRGALLRGLAFVPEGRFRSMRALLGVLDPSLAGLSGPAVHRRETRLDEAG